MLVIGANVIENGCLSLRVRLGDLSRVYFLLFLPYDSWDSLYKACCQFLAHQA